MDHVLNAIEVYFDVYLDEFMDYHKTGKYEKLSDNPSYKEIKAIIEAMNPIRKFLGYENIKLSEEVKYYND